MPRERKRNVFDDLGLNPEEAAALHLKATLHSDIVRLAKAKKYSQKQLQVILSGKATDQRSIAGENFRVQSGHTG